MFLKLTGKIKQIIPGGLSVVDFLGYMGVITACFLLFQHPDLFHTSASSYSYLNGHVADFYDYNGFYIPGGGDQYLPLIYIIFFSTVQMK